MSLGSQCPAGTPELSSCGPAGCVVHPGQGPGRPCPGGAGLGGRHWNPLRLLSPRSPGEWWSPARRPTHTLTLCPVPGSQAACHFPHRTALPSMCWPEMGTPPTSRLGKGPPGLTPTSFLGYEELGGYPHGPLCPALASDGEPPSQGGGLLAVLSSELMTLPRAPLSLGPSYASSRAWDQGLLALLGNYSPESSSH